MATDRSVLEARIRREVEEWFDYMFNSGPEEVSLAEVRASGCVEVEFNRRLAVALSGRAPN